MILIINIIISIHVSKYRNIVNNNNARAHFNKCLRQCAYGLVIVL